MTIVIPKKHICCANEINSDNSEYVAKVFEAIPKVAKAEGIESYRIISNCGDDAGQTVKHLHFHVLGGVKMGWELILSVKPNKEETSFEYLQNNYCWT